MKTSKKESNVIPIIGTDDKISSSFKLEVNKKELDVLTASLNGVVANSGQELKNVPYIVRRFLQFEKIAIQNKSKAIEISIDHSEAPIIEMALNAGLKYFAVQGDNDRQITAIETIDKVQKGYFESGGKQVKIG